MSDLPPSEGDSPRDPLLLPTDSQTHEVGYKRPPRAHRFQSGCSGNPRGRPRKTADAPSTAVRCLSQTRSVRLADRTATMTIREVLVRKLIDQAMKGCLRSAKMILDLERQAKSSLPASDTAPQEDALTATDVATIALFRDRVAAAPEPNHQEAQP